MQRHLCNRYRELHQRGACCRACIQADGDRLVKYDYGELDEVSLAYAVSIHKSQKSEFPAVVIPFAMQHYMLLQRNLIYIGITRGKRLLVPWVGGRLRRAARLASIRTESRGDLAVMSQ
jgi:ATP-dependent exoDNAse (exonuclease V) alpha subunit